MKVLTVLRDITQRHQAAKFQTNVRTNRFYSGEGNNIAFQSDQTTTAHSYQYVLCHTTDCNRATEKVTFQLICFVQMYNKTFDLCMV